MAGEPTLGRRSLRRERQLTMRHQGLPSLLILACLASAPLAALAQSAPAPDSTPRRSVTLAPPPTQPIAWSSLSPSQQAMLAPVRGQWEQLHPKRQQTLATHARHWSTLPPERREQINQRLTRWASMTPAQRRQLNDNARAFHKLSPEERAKVSAAYRRFQSLSPEERRALRERWRATSPQQHMPAHLPMHPPHGGRR